MVRGLACKTSLINCSCAGCRSMDRRSMLFLAVAERLALGPAGIAGRVVADHHDSHIGGLGRFDRRVVFVIEGEVYLDARADLVPDSIERSNRIRDAPLYSPRRHRWSAGRPPRWTSAWTCPKAAGCFRFFRRTTASRVTWRAAACSRPASRAPDPL